MTTIQFKQVNYSLSLLVDQIQMGAIALPDIQRPFVWKAVKVRDLFDSMYRGYPIGYLLFWDNVIEPGARQIGSDDKQLAPQQLIVDGQQRLTSLYAVTKGLPVLTQDYKETRIQIAFSPVTERFAVADATTRANPEWIPDISEVWNSPLGIYQFTNDYISRLRGDHELEPEEEARMAQAIQKLADISNFPFTALALSSALDEEKVAEIFVRINSEGVRLRQADFILTLMSVFWDKGRKELEDFSRLSRQPTAGAASPFNPFIEPDPDQLLRVGVALAFRRARLETVYSILRGKDLQTGDFSAERRDQQFGVLQSAQEGVLDLTNWHEFLKALMAAGYRGKHMIASQTNLMYTYAFYLIGLRDFHVDRKTLRHVIARWFYMTSVTSRYTGSSETQMESDLARLRNAKTAQDFVDELNRSASAELTNDYWDIKLPNDLERTLAKNPVLLAYYAALCALDARVLFSQMKVTTLLDPSVHAKKASIERHHLFPRAYLEGLGIQLPEINQLANFAFVEWNDNIAIGYQAPMKYYPAYVRHFSGEDLDKMVFWHALPENWHDMEYRAFLDARRHLIAKVIRAGWETLSLLSDPEGGSDREVSPSFSHSPEHWTVPELIQLRESARVEFKSSARWNYERGEKGREIEDAVVKTIAGFMNRLGGTLLIGVADDGAVLGLERDLSTLKKHDLDSFENWLVTLFEQSLGKPALGNIVTSFVEIAGAYVARVDARRSTKPVYAKTSKGSDLFFVRAGNSTREMSARETVEYIEQYWDAKQSALENVPQSTSTLPEQEGPPDIDIEHEGSQPDLKRLEQDFHAAMVEVYTRAKAEAGYNAVRFLGMLSEMGGIETAKQLLATPNTSEGFQALWHAKRLDLSVEAHVLQPKFAALFSEEELATARDRLSELGFSTPTDK